MFVSNHSLPKDPPGSANLNTKTHPVKQHTGLSPRTKMGLAAITAAAIPCLSYLALRQVPTLPPATEIGLLQLPASKILTTLIIGICSVAVYCLTGSCRQAKEEKHPQSLTKLANKNSGSDHIKTFDTAIIKNQSPQECLQEWWDIVYSDKPMPPLSSYEVKVLYDMLKSIEKELNQSPSKKITNPLINIKTHTPNSLEVEFNIPWEFDHQGNAKYKYGTHDLSLNKHNFKRLFAGFILSQKTSFFAFMDGIGRGGFIIYPNINGVLENRDIVGADDMLLQTREGPVSNKTVWKIGKDSICRSVNGNKQLPQKKEEQRLSNKAPRVDFEQKARQSLSFETPLHIVERKIPIDQNELNKISDFCFSLNEAMRCDGILGEKVYTEINQAIKHINEKIASENFSVNTYERLIDKLHNVLTTKWNDDLLFSQFLVDFYNLTSKIHTDTALAIANQCVHSLNSKPEILLPYLTYIIETTVNNTELREKANDYVALQNYISNPPQKSNPINTNKILQNNPSIQTQVKEADYFKNMTDEIWNQYTEKEKVKYLHHYMQKKGPYNKSDEFCQEKLLELKDLFGKSKLSDEEFELFEMCLIDNLLELRKGNNAAIFAAYKDLHKKDCAKRLVQLFEMVRNVFARAKIVLPDCIGDQLPTTENTIELFEAHLNVAFCTEKFATFGCSKYKAMETLLMNCKKFKALEPLYQKFLELIKNDQNDGWNQVIANLTTDELPESSTLFLK